MTKEDWRKFGFDVGEFATRELMQMKALSMILKGAGKATQVLSNELKNTVQKGTLYVNLQNPTPTEVAARMAKTEQQITGQAGPILGDAEIATMYTREASQTVPQAAVRVEEAVEKTGTLFNAANTAVKSTETARALQGAGIAGEAVDALTQPQAGTSTNKNVDKGKYPADRPAAAVEDKGKFKGATKEPAQRTGRVEKKDPTIVNDVVSSKRTGSALKKDAHHAFNDIIDNYASHASTFDFKGGDGKIRKLFQIEGSLDGIDGVFEWIVEPQNNLITHRLFIKNGNITGKPNVWKNK